MKEFIMKYRSILVIFLPVVLFLSLFSIYTVYETDRAIVTVLGKLVSDGEGGAKVMDPGLHFKLPFVSTVIRLDARIQTLDIKDSRIVTIEKKDVLVNSFVKWKIRNFAQFFKATGGVFSRADDLLEQKVSDGLRAQFGRSTIRGVVSENRENIMKELRHQIDESAQSLGIEVIDVRIKRIDLPDEVSSSVYERMRAEREQVAAGHRADGERRSEEIRAKADEEGVVIVAQAKSQARIIQGDADAKATALYGKAYSKDADFYAFMRSLQAYEDTFKSKQDIFVLSPDSEFFDYFDKTRSAP
jgi:membrane protease subunit HflC